MSSSFIGFKKKGFWIMDGLVEVVALFVLKKIETQQEFIPDWLKKIKEDYSLITQGTFSSFNDLGFDDYLINEDRIFIFLKIINEVIDDLKERGDYVPKEELNIYVKNSGQSEWPEDVEVERIINVFDYLKNLIKGKITTDSSNSIRYKF